MADETVEVDLGRYSISVATAFGPRVTGLRLGDGPELFAVLGPDVVIQHPDSDVYRPRGGHRLWAAPEHPPITYAADDRPCEVSIDPGQVTITGPVDDAGLGKQIVVESGGTDLAVEHTLTNAGSETIAVAPWAITQVGLGGQAIIPLGGDQSGNGLIANRSVVLWPYPDLTDPRVAWNRDAVVIDATPGPAFKIGTGPRPGRLGYLSQGLLFTKTVSGVGEGTYPDREAVGQVYVDHMFCELESMGPVVPLPPGEAVSHRESWAIEPCPDLATAVEVVTEGLTT